MKIIPVKLRGKSASVPMRVDDWDFGILKSRAWWASSHEEIRPMTTVGGKNKSAHRLIVWCPEGYVIDHIDGDPLNNQQVNLRVCTRSQNLANQKLSKKNTSGYKGVYLNKGKWVAGIKQNGKRLFIGTFKSKEDAARAYDKAALEIFGDYALTNATLAQPHG